MVYVLQSLGVTQFDEYIHNEYFSLAASRRENPRDSRKARAQRSEARSALQVTRDRGGAETEDGRFESGER